MRQATDADAGLSLFWDNGISPALMSGFSLCWIGPDMHIAFVGLSFGEPCASWGTWGALSSLL